MTTNYAKYVDFLGRWHVKPTTESKPFPTNNAYIYSFYAKMVGLPVVITTPAASQLMDLDEKVLTRHPGVYPPEGVSISYDEYVGAAGLDQIYAANIVEFGEKNHWQFCDIPGFTPTPFRKLVIDDVLAAYEDLANEENPRRATIKYPALWPVAFYHRPNEQYFYYRCAGRSPGCFRTLYFIAATLYSIFKKDQGSPMLGFKMLKIKSIGPNLLEKGLIYLFNKRGKFLETCKNYFPEDHPILNSVINRCGESRYSGGGI